MSNTNEKKKKGFLAAIWESMTKTGGCCGSGESCCCSSKPDKDNARIDKEKGNPLSSRSTNSSEERKK
jgi:hypothetical protein